MCSRVRVMCSRVRPRVGHAASLQSPAHRRGGSLAVAPCRPGAGVVASWAGDHWAGVADRPHHCQRLQTIGNNCPPFGRGAREGARSRPRQGAVARAAKRRRPQTWSSRRAHPRRAHRGAPCPQERSDRGTGAASPPPPQMQNVSAFRRHGEPPPAQEGEGLGEGEGCARRRKTTSPGDRPGRSSGHRQAARSACARASSDSESTGKPVCVTQGHAGSAHCRVSPSDFHRLPKQRRAAAPPAWAAQTSGGRRPASHAAPPGTADHRRQADKASAGAAG